MAKIMTEKRPAKVGEKILITNTGLNGGRYGNGDVRKVTEVHPGGVKVEEHSIPILHEEYEVIIEEMGGIIEKMQAEINELKAKVGALEKRDNAKPFDFEGVGSIPYYRKLNKSPQERRDEIVAQAKADVEALIAHGKENQFGHNVGNNTYQQHFYAVEFVVNASKRTVVALVKLANGYGEVFSVKHKGIAKCAPDDCFNASLGRAIALRRALGLTVPAEYLNAPQPTEVRVGDVVKYKGEKRIAAVVIDGESINVRKQTYLSTAENNAHKIIDDSRENV